MPSHIEETVQRHGVKPTPQRAVIAEYLLSITAIRQLTRFSSRLKQIACVVIRVTVYNTLNILVGAGVLKEVVRRARQIERRRNVTEHHHFVDVKTGEVLEIDNDVLSSHL